MISIELFLNKIKESGDFLIKDGYGFDFVGSIVEFTKSDSNNGYQISFQIKDYWSHVDINGLSAYKRFNNVEQEICSLFDMDINSFYTIHTSPNVENIPKGLAFTLFGNNIDFKISNEAELGLFMDFVKTFYYKTVIPFFDEHKTINIVNSKLRELLDNKKIQSLLTSTGNTTILRFYVVAILNNNFDILQFFDTIYFPYLQDNLDNELGKIEYDRLLLIQQSMKNLLK